MKIEKLRERIMSVPPKKDITFEEMDAFLKSYGFELKRDANNAHPLYAHRIHKDLIASFAKPHGKTNEIKLPYVKVIQNTIAILLEREKGP